MLICSKIITLIHSAYKATLSSRFGIAISSIFMGADIDFLITKLQGFVLPLITLTYAAAP